MTDYGLLTLNDYGYTQIDSTYQNHVLAQKGTVTFPTSEVSSTSVTVTYSGTGASAPLIFLSSPHQSSATYYAPNYYGYGNVAASNYTLSGTEFTWTLYADVGANGTTINYYIFDVPPDISSSSAGLIVYNASGTPVFNSDEQYLKIVGYGAVPSLVSFSTGSPLAETVNNVTLTLPSGTYAVCQTCPRMCTYSIESGLAHYFAMLIDGVSVDSTTVYVQPLCFWPISAGNPSPNGYDMAVNAGPTTVLVADVSLL